MTISKESSKYNSLIDMDGLSGLLSQRRRWLVTGAAGFIGSHLVEALLASGQDVTGLDDLSTGYRHNIEQAISYSGSVSSFKFIEGSILSKSACNEACEGADFILHHAALASVPLSIEKPSEFSAVNSEGFVNILEAARKFGVSRVVYASSSAVYGDNPELPKREDMKVECLSPYALTKAINELYADMWNNLYGLETVGLRYFNVFGPRQDPNGAYAAVIPRWIDAMKTGKPAVIYGDGTASRDFCSVYNVVLANLRAAFAPGDSASGRVFNIACGVSTTLNELFGTLKNIYAHDKKTEPVYQPARKGDILHSLASIEQAVKVLGYTPHIQLMQGLQ